ncbi:MAG: hypothetical protein H7Z37_01135 [Pyrinomonadaceae bacterium]|nr:hypothetical protein [Pyrinomonadaceae bacterium]
MVHFFWLLLIGVVLGAAFGCFTEGSASQKVSSGAKTFLQFAGISLALGWLFYFLPF